VVLSCHVARRVFGAVARTVLTASQTALRTCTVVLSCHVARRVFGARRPQSACLYHHKARPGHTRRNWPTALLPSAEHAADPLRAHPPFFELAWLAQAGVRRRQVGDAHAQALRRRKHVLRGKVRGADGGGRAVGKLDPCARARAPRGGQRRGQDGEQAKRTAEQSEHAVEVFCAYCDAYMPCEFFSAVPARVAGRAHAKAAVVKRPCMCRNGQQCNFCRLSR